MTVGAVLFSTLAIPGTAHAEAPTIKSAASDQDDWSVIDVNLGYSTEIDKITAKLRPLGSAETDTPVATITDFTKQQAGATDGTWASSPVHLDTLGEYTIDIEATNTAGETTAQQNVGVLRYVKQPLFKDFSVTPTEPNVENKIVTAAGDLVFRDPSTRETAPAPGASVIVSLPGLSQETVTTNEAGHFSLAREVTQNGTAWARYQSDDGPASSPRIDITPQYAPTRFVLDKTSFHVTAGDEVPVTGKLEYQIGSEWKPLAGIPVELDYKYGSITDPAEATTDTNGRFSLVKRPYGDNTYEVAFPPYPIHSWLKRPAAVDVSIKVTSTTKFTEFTASMDQMAQLSVTGRLALVGDYDDSQVKVDVQWSADGSTGWSTKKTIKTTFGSQFSAEGIETVGDGYFRLRYAGSTTKDIKGAISKAVRKNRALVRVKGANASPEPVRKGRALTVTGVLQEAKPASTPGWNDWKGYGAKTVQIIFRPKGEKTWYLMGTVKTKANGSFSKSFKAQLDGTWVPAFLKPDSKHYAGAGAEDYVDVR
ncbi:hypothetical protein SGFS_057680 [Streptomyces graminofaciens]|uniref:Carboxypeptidase regulatory-like domain-containing protein n=1 Tax=Streptomyces graminofaciens TaxID=68212 RepID=A0ABM7FEF5_9ACTN|nr:hypothetical protein [Streptomyces graminofaciens]BBC34474.1 hypothetical protein SGFS_057680 [Streptomyces graminofaciens]